MMLSVRLRKYQPDAHRERISQEAKAEGNASDMLTWERKIGR